MWLILSRRNAVLRYQRAKLIILRRKNKKCMYEKNKNIEVSTAASTRLRQTKMCLRCLLV